MRGRKSRPVDGRNSRMNKGVDEGVVGEKRWIWQAFAVPGVIWLAVLFLIPFYAILAVAMGRLDPILSTAEPVWNPLQWDPSAFSEVLSDIFSGQLTRLFLRTFAYVGIASFLCLLI